MNVKRLIIIKWNSFLLCLLSLLLTYLSFNQSRYVLGTATLVLVVIKLYGIFSNNSTVRKVGLVGLNMVWAATMAFMLSIQPPFMPDLSYYFPVFVLLLGFGISIQERFK